MNNISDLTLHHLLAGDSVKLKNPCILDDNFKQDLLHDFIVEGLSLGVKQGVLPPKHCLEDGIDQLLWSLNSYRREIERLQDVRDRRIPDGMTRVQFIESCEEQGIHPWDVIDGSCEDEG